MAIPFRLIGLPREKFADWLSLDDDELRARGGRRIVADEKPGYPCRVSLADAEPGERVLLIPFVHHDVASSYRASGPIYVREVAVSAKPAVNEIPLMLRHRLLSVRAYDSSAMMVGAEVVEGSRLEEAIQRFLGETPVDYLHIHNARPGCYDCRVERA